MKQLHSFSNFVFTHFCLSLSGSLRPKTPYFGYPQTNPLHPTTTTIDIIVGESIVGESMGHSVPLGGNMGGRRRNNIPKPICTIILSDHKCEGFDCIVFKLQLHFG